MTWTKRQLKQSFPCNGAYIKYLRKRKGWSQRQLVQASGYSVRLVSKAESNGRIVLATLVDLAQALSTDTEVVRPEQLIFDPIAVAKFLTYATYVLQRNMYSRLCHIITDDFVLESIGDPERFPFVGRYEGAEGLQAAVDNFFSCMEVPPSVDHAKWYDYYTHREDPNVVVVWGKSWIHSINEPVGAPLDVTQKITFRDGKVSRIENRYDASATKRTSRSSAARSTTESTSPR